MGELPGVVDSIHVFAAGRDLDPPPGFSVPYALQTLLDELTMPPVVLRDGAPEEIEPLASGGVVEFGEPIGAAETIHTLHSELRTFGDSFGCREASFRLSLSPDLLSTLRELTEAPEAEIRRIAGEAVPPSSKTVSVHLVEASGGGRSVRVRAVTEPIEALRLGGRNRVDRGARGGSGAAAGQGADRGPRRGCPRALHRARGDVLGARAAGLPVRAHDPGGGAGLKVGVPTEIKPDEYRVALTPVGARELAEHGHEILIQRGAGEGSAISDSSYETQGARIVPAAEDVFGEADLVLKVKEPQPRRSRCSGPRPLCSPSCTWRRPRT